MAERKIRSKDERIAEIDSKIAYHKQCIQVLEQKKDGILNPKTRNRKVKSVNRVITMAKESGLTVEEIAKKLGITLE